MLFQQQLFIIWKEKQKLIIGLIKNLKLNIKILMEKYQIDIFISLLENLVFVNIHPSQKHVINY